MLSKLDDYMRFNESALSLREKRQTVLASNIANADTPNYKARDIDFSSAMKAAVEKASPNAAASAAASMKTTAARHFPNPPTDGGVLGDGTPLLYRGVVQGAVDGNTVDMDVERNQFADNAVRYEASLTTINAQIKGMMNALQSGN